VPGGADAASVRARGISGCVEATEMASTVAQRSNC